MLWACLLLPSLPLEVFTRAQAPADAARPFAVASGGRDPRVVAANAAAAEAGVRAGQLVSASLALAPGLLLRDRAPDAEAAALAAVATWAAQFTPAVSLAPPQAVLAEIGGSLRLFGGQPRLAAHLARGVRDLGFAAQPAFAPTPTAALLFARAGRTAALPDAAALPRALGPLPLACLDADPAALATLAAAGITTFGAVCALPREALGRRVGAAFVAILDRARGLVPDPRLPFVPAPRYDGRLELPAATDSVEALAFAVNRLVHELAGWLLGRGLGVVALTLTLMHERAGPSQARIAPPRGDSAQRQGGSFERAGPSQARIAPPRGDSAQRQGGSFERAGPPQARMAATTVRFALAAPAREAEHLVAVLRERLARVALPAAVVAIALASEETAPLAGRNLGLLPGDAAIAAVPLFDRLRARLGDDAVTLLAPHAEHRPERASKNGVRPQFPARASKEKMGSDPIFPPRPLWLLAEPEPLGHLLEAQPWVLQDGPERIESGWWDGGDVRRDYFVAENPRGETVWIYRDHRYGSDDGEWFLHGVFA